METKLFIETQRNFVHVLSDFLSMKEGGGQSGEVGSKAVALEITHSFEEER